MDSCVRWRRRPIPANAITAGRPTWNSSSPISSGCSDGGKTTPMATREDIPAADRLPGGSSLEVLAVFFRLGLASFGGPVAHLGYFREEFVRRRRWLDDKSGDAFPIDGAKLRAVAKLHQVEVAENVGVLDDTHGDQAAAPQQIKAATVHRKDRTGHL